MKLDFFRHTKKFLSQKIDKRSLYDSSGDSAPNCNSKNINSYNNKYMSWSATKGKKSKRKMDMSPDKTYASKFAKDYVQKLSAEINDDPAEQTLSSAADYSSDYSNDRVNPQAAFPFMSTPSGNLKVQSNQVVFQSSVVGILLADPSQAKIKVEFESKGASQRDEINDQYNVESESDPILQYDHRTTKHIKPLVNMNLNKTAKQRHGNDENGKDLGSLGYTILEPIDWIHVQLPKKQDLYQEFYKRIHNHVNTDTIIRIGEDVFHCHRIVLQVYSSFFDTNHHWEIDLPMDRVSSKAFNSIYEWMMMSNQEGTKILRRDNILDLFRAAQFLNIKDLEDQCWAFIVNENLFNEDTAFALYREARDKNMMPVVDLMVPRVRRFFLPLVASKDFLYLEPEEVLTFLKSNYICVTSEIEVLMAGIRWLYADWSSRRDLAVEVMKCVRFGLISPWQLVDIKRNPDNGEILEIVNATEVQQMVDDGLAYVIIKYWYGNNSKNYYHWIDVLGLVEPAERNWIGEEMNHVTYKDFLKYLEQFMVPKEQMYQQMTMMQPPRRNDDVPGSMRGVDDDKTNMRRKMDFPLPATLKGLAGDKFPTMSEFFDSRRKDRSPCPSPTRSPTLELDSPPATSRKVCEAEKGRNTQQEEQRHTKVDLQRLSPHGVRMKEMHEVHMCSVHRDPRSSALPPAKDSADLEPTNSETSTATVETSITNQFCVSQASKKRHSVAASYLAAATAALTAPKSPPISLFNQSKESLAKLNKNKMSASILGPTNKNYIVDGSLFNWDRETVLVFGGIDPNEDFGSSRNTGKDIYRFDPLNNVWENVGELPEPRHHHSVAFLRGRVYLVGGADPRDDESRGKSVVVSTVWRYEPVSKSWYSEKDLSTPRKNFGLVVHRMALYAIGGQDKKGRVLRSVERFDIKSGSWSEVAPMGVARSAVAAVKYRDYIWVAGGMTGKRRRPVCQIVECYNSKTDQWTEIHDLRFPRCFATLFAMDDKLYIVGGAGKVTEKEKTASSLDAIDVWDWKDRQWKLEAKMSIPRHGHALAYLGTQLIIIGGVTTIYMRALNNVESFCCERGAWIRGVAVLPSPLSGHGAVTLPPASLM